MSPLAALIDAHQEGLNDREVAERIGESASAVNHVRQMLRLQPRRRWAPGKTLAGRRGDELRDLAAKGLTVVETAKAMGLSVNCVQYLRGVLDIAPVRKRVRK